MKDCKSLHRCKQCQRRHHSLLHIDGKDVETPVNHAAVLIQSDLLLMTCQVLVESPQGKTRKNKLFWTLDHAYQRAICGIAGLSSSSHNQSIANFKVTPVHSPSRKFNVNAIVVPRVTCDLPEISLSRKWEHLDGLQLADPEFGKPGNIEVLLGVEIFVDVIRQGRRKDSRDRVWMGISR